MSKHTAGPWVAREYDGLIQIASDVAARNIANIEWHSGIEPIDHTNARLIAAAPEMLEALKKVREELRDRIDGSLEKQGMDTFLTLLINDIDAAIRKAEEGQ